jgi:hypothetical protein
MKCSNFICLLLLSLLFSSCDRDIQVGENTFVHKEKIYKIIDNELREIGDLSAREIKKFEVSKPKQKDFGNSSLSFVKPGASTTLKALYRGNYLYYSLRVYGINDLRDNYSSGALTIEFVDEFGFIMHATEIRTNDLVAMVGDDGKTDSFVYNGKTEMSTEINSAIKSYSVIASFKRKSYYGY